jgi:hypothetical protein
MLSLSFFGLSTLGSVVLGLVGDHVGISGALRLGGLAIVAISAALLVGSRIVFEPVLSSEKKEPRPEDRSSSTMGGT